MHSCGPMGRWWMGILFLGAGLLGVAGCGGPRTHPVKGKVVFPDSAPLTGGIVEFEALNPEMDQVPNARGTIRKDGTFDLGTYKEGDGALAGEHRALVIPPLLTDEALARGAKPAIDSRFRRYETSGLQYTIKPEVNEIIITVQKPGQ